MTQEEYRRLEELNKKLLDIYLQKDILDVECSLAKDERNQLLQDYAKLSLPERTRLERGF